jgi:hypothetical protein
VTERESAEGPPPVRETEGGLNPARAPQNPTESRGKRRRHHRVLGGPVQISELEIKVPYARPLVVNGKGWNPGKSAFNPRRRGRISRVAGPQGWALLLVDQVDSMTGPRLREPRREGWPG